MTSLVNRRPLRIEWGQCDPAGIVFNRRFFEFFDQGTWLLFEIALGVKMQDLAKTFDIVGIPLVDARAQFRKPAKFGDAAEIASRVTEFRRSSFDVEHKIFIDGELAIEGGETRIWAGRDKNDPSRMVSRPVPQDVIRRFG
ncbi:MAG TPA: thioesterase family protein [Pseudolabrys sp.]|nr:thioesterase family protein [Pseudolabrys sp.]